MDENKRGFIESMMDRVLQEERELIESVEWIQGETPISSVRDLALGYILGNLEGVSLLYSSFNPRSRLSDEEYKEVLGTIRAILKRRLPKIIEIIELGLNR